MGLRNLFRSIGYLIEDSRDYVRCKSLDRKDRVQLKHRDQFFKKMDKKYEKDILRTQFQEDNLKDASLDVAVGIEDLAANDYNSNLGNIIRAASSMQWKAIDEAGCFGRRSATREIYSSKRGAMELYMNKKHDNDHARMRSIRYRC